MLNQISEQEKSELQALIEKLSVNYQENKFTPSYPLREEFYKKAQVQLFTAKGLKPEVLPTESTIMLGNALAGKTLLMSAWREMLQEKRKEIEFNRDEYVRRHYEFQWFNEYYGDLSNTSRKWLNEQEIRKFYRNHENTDKTFTNIVWKKYWFLDDLFFGTYPYNDKTSDNGFISYMESIFRFLEINADIIVIASTNNYPQDMLAGDKNKTILNRYEAIFKNQIQIGERK